MSSAIAMMNNKKNSKYTRNIAQCVHFVRQAHAQGLFIPVKIPGEINPADVGTKIFDWLLIVNSQAWLTHIGSSLAKSKGSVNITNVTGTDLASLRKILLLKKQDITLDQGSKSRNLTLEVRSRIRILTSSTLRWSKIPVS